MDSLAQGWQMGFITPPNTDQIVVSLFCIVLQRILRLSLDSQEMKTLHQLSLSTLGRNVKTALTFPSVCQFWFLWEDETNFTETPSNQHRCGQDTLAFHTLQVWCAGPMVTLKAPPHLQMFTPLCNFLSLHVACFSSTNYSKGDET